MKILFGVQATGNGHISRARALNTYLNALGAEVDYIFSGRDPDDYFDMQEFKQPRFLRGLTLIHEQGRVLLNQTLAKNSLIKLVQDVQKTDTRRYDLVLTDFEPISAWAAKQQQTPCIGIGHQYAFYDAIPKAEDSALGRAIIRLVSPCSAYLGLHWHHFGQAILPPIVNLPAAAPKEKKRYLVYLAFEDPADILEFFEPFEDATFVCYGSFKEPQMHGNVLFKPASKWAFQQDLLSAQGVICNAGFELASEALQLGVKLLVKPLQGQFEQASNARALVELGLGLSMHSLDQHKLQYWIEHFHPRKITYPNVAQALARWIVSGAWRSGDFNREKIKLAQQLWCATDFSQTPWLNRQRHQAA